VPVLDAADVADLYFSRAVVETATVEALALRRTPIDQARHACEALKQTSEENSGVLPFVQWDVKFHRALVDAVRSPRLRRMHDAVMGEVELCMAQVQVHQLLDPSVIVAEHEGILAATIAGDSPAAVRLMRAHLEAASTELQRYLSERDAAVGHSADG
jgi:DNA-binding GntR family transcriptional regulator